MIKGLYAAASAMIANVHRQKIIAHNAANVDTAGFKQILTSMDAWVSTSVIHPPGNTAISQKYLGLLGLGVETPPDFDDFEAGAIKTTGNQFDFAISGEGFFTVETPEGERYTRDGRFLRDVDNMLVTVDGFAVLDENGQSIELPEGDMHVSDDGTISVNGEEVTRIVLVGFENPAEELAREGDNTFSAAGGPTLEDVGLIKQGYLEMSNVNISALMTQMVQVARSYEAAQKMVQTQDEILGKAITTLGRF